MWSRTVMLYMPGLLDAFDPPSPTSPSISNPVTERRARRRGKARHDRRQIVELALAGHQHVERRILEQPERERHPPRRVPACALRIGDRADLRRLHRQPPRVESFAERDGNDAVAVPAHLDDRRLEAGEPERELEA